MPSGEISQPDYLVQLPAKRGVMRNFESPEHAFGAGDVFETTTRSNSVAEWCCSGGAISVERVAELTISNSQTLPGGSRHP
jgi:hypothetical protein